MYPDVTSWVVAKQWEGTQCGPLWANRTTEAKCLPSRKWMLSVWIWAKRSEPTLVLLVSKSSEGAAREWSTVVDISIPLPSFKLVSLSSPRISSTLKHPNMSFF